MQTNRSTTDLPASPSLKGCKPPTTRHNENAEALALRGLAIIGIFLHNYCHWLNPVVKENEYTYSQHRVDAFNHAVLHADALLPMHLLSFFGHYGVPIFLFLSAYGLVKKYETSAPISSSNTNDTGFLHFASIHFLKLFRMMIVGFTAFVLVDAVTPGAWHYDVLKITAQLLMFNNILPNPDHQIWPGPYWFFGLMLQFYLLYRLLLYRRHWAVTVGLMLLCVGIQLLLTPDGDAMNRYRYNFMGGMLPFGVGLLYARFEGQTRLNSMPPATLFIGTLLFSFASMLLSQSFFGWTFVPVTVCAAALFLVKFLASKHLLTPLLHTLAGMGTLSAALFISHPITRKILIPISRHGDTYTGLLLYIIASIGVAWLFYEILKKMPHFKPRY